MAIADAQATPTPHSAFKTLPIYAVASGAALIAMTLGADLLGFGKLLGENEALKNRIIQIGLAIAGLGALADLTVGQRSLLTRLKAIADDWPGLLKFGAIALQLGLLTVIVRMFYLEHHAFYNNVMLMAFYGFIIHYFLPAQYRLGFFVALSIATFVGILGFADSAWLLGISTLLIGICRLSVSQRAKAVMLVAAGGILTAMRLGDLPSPWSKAIWPILGSMFMFRLIIYLYDLRHKKIPQNREGLAPTTAYFFLLPNVAFPLFPVVDSATFHRTYYNDDQYRIYQKGVKWMFWGVVHLLIYRYLNYYWVIAPEKVGDTYTLMQYMISNYLLIIRLSGQFHLVIGILHLFGFNLPRIMDLYLLATSFLDYWRRINVYWKEFIQKVFYYPAYFKMRQLGNTTKLVLATALGFLMTWFFHTYQWFWIQGTFNVSIPDSLFWTSLGLLVLVNSLYEAKYGRKRVLGRPTFAFGEIVSKTLRAAGIFIVMTLLWSMWISPSVADWLALLADANVTLGGVAIAVALLVAALGAAMTINEIFASRFAETPDRKPAFWAFAAPTASLIALLYFLALPEYSYRLGSGASNLIADLRINRLGTRDAELLERGYYEELNNVNLFNTQLWELYMKKPDNWKPLSATKAVRLREDLLGVELVPSVKISFKDTPFYTNRWGLRDDDYEQSPPPNTFRIVMLGGSITMGSGVVHEETFEHLVEKKLNGAAGKKYARYEILNFAVASYNAIQRLITFERKALAFKPDALFFVVHPRDEEKEMAYLAKAFVKDVDIPYDFLKEVLQRADVSRKMNRAKVARELEPFEAEVTSWIYRHLVELCRQHGVMPVLICLPSVPGDNEMQEAAGIVRMAEEAGFAVLNLADVYDEHKGEYLVLAPWDRHPNARGHRIVAERLYEALQNADGKLQLGLAPAASAANGANMK